MPTQKQSPEKKSYQPLVSTILIALIVGGSLLLNPYGFDFYGLPKVFWTHLLVSAALLVWLLQINQDAKSRLSRTPLDLPLFSWLALLILFTFFSVSLSNSLFGESQRYGGLLTQLSYIFLLILTANLVRNEDQIEKINLAIVITGAVVSSYAIAQHYGLDLIDWSKGGNEARLVVSTLGNSNFLGDYLVLVIPIALIGYFTLPKRRYYYLAAFALSYAALLFSSCRAGWAGLAVSALFFALPSMKPLWNKQRVWLLALIAVTITITLSINFFGAGSRSPLLVKRIASSIEMGEGTVAQRLSIWQSSLKVIKVRPLSGWGLETFGLVFPRFQLPSYHQLGGATRLTDKTHNESLQIAVSSGLLSLLAFLWLFTAFAFKSWQTISQMEALDKKSLTQIGYLSSLAGYLVAVQFSFSATGVAFLFWLILGLSAAHQRSLAEKQPVYSFRRPLIAVLLVLAFLTSAFSGATTGRELLGDIRLRQGLLAYSAGQLDAAVLDVRQATALAPHRDFYRQILTNVYIANYEETRYFAWLTQAREEGEKMTALNPDRSSTHLLIAQIGLLQFNTVKSKEIRSEIVKRLTTALKLDPYSVQAHYHLGIFYQLNRQKEKALSHYQKAGRLDKNLPPPEVIWETKEKELGPTF